MPGDGPPGEDGGGGNFHDRGRGWSATPPASSPPARARAPRTAGKARPRPAARTQARPPWSRSQEKLALLYNEQGLRPDEIAEKLGLSRYVVSQIILNALSRGKL